MSDEDINYMEGMACPKCGQKTALEIESSALVRITKHDLEVLDGQFTLFDGSPTRCFDCGYVGDFEEFRAGASPPVNTPMPVPKTPPTYH